MNYDDINDYEVLFMVREQNEDAQELLYNKYYNLIDIITKKYYKQASILGVENKDLMQEALIGFSYAINKFKDDYDNNFKSFLTLCIERRISKFLRTLNKNNNKMMINYLPIDKLEDSNNINKISDINNNPSIRYEELDYFNNIIMNAYNRLSDQELKVFKLLIKGLSIKEISTNLNISYKSVDNTIQRIKNKLK